MRLLVTTFRNLFYLLLDVNFKEKNDTKEHCLQQNLKSESIQSRRIRLFYLANVSSFKTEDSKRLFIETSASLLSHYCQCMTHYLFFHRRIMSQTFS